MHIWQQEYLTKYLTSNSIKQTDWKVTKKAWEEEETMTSGMISFTGSRTRTFKSKALYRRLPTAHTKHTNQLTYPTTQCLYCDQVETSDHVFRCNFATRRLDIILIQITQQIDDQHYKKNVIMNTLL